RLSIVMRTASAVLGCVVAARRAVRRSAHRAVPLSVRLSVPLPMPLSVRLAILCAALLAALVPLELRAQLPPHADWRTVRTTNFDVHFTPELEQLARRAAVVAETAWVRLSTELESPRGRVQ